MFYRVKADVLERLFFLRTALFCVFSVFLFLASFPLACHALSLCLPCAYALPALCLRSACHVPALYLPCPCSLLALSLLPACHAPAPCLLCPCSLCALFLRMVGDGIARLVVNGRYRAMCCCERV